MSVVVEDSSLGMLLLPALRAIEPEIEKICRPMSANKLFQVIADMAFQASPSSCLTVWLRSNIEPGTLYRVFTYPEALGVHSSNPKVSVARSTGTIFEQLPAGPGVAADWFQLKHMNDSGMAPGPGFCSGSGGTAWLRFPASDGAEVILTLCVPKELSGEFAAYRILAPIVGQLSANALQYLAGTRRDRLLHEIALADVAAGVNFKECFDCLARLIRDALSAKGCSIFYYDRTRSKNLILAGTTGLVHPATRKVFSRSELNELFYKPDEGLTGMLFTSSQVIRLDDARAGSPSGDGARWHSEAAKSAEYPIDDLPRPFLGGPLFADGSCVGVVRLHGSEREAGVFLPTDESFLNSLVRPLGAIIHRRLARFEASGTQEQYSEFARLLDGVHKAVTYEELGGAIATCTKSIFKADAATFWQVQKDATSGSYSVKLVAKQPTESNLFHSSLDSHKRRLRDVAQTGQPLLLDQDSLLNSMSLLTPAAKSPLSSYLCNVVTSEDNIIIGIVEVAAQNRFAFGLRDCESPAYGALSRQASIAFKKLGEQAAERDATSQAFTAHQDALVAICAPGVAHAFKWQNGNMIQKLDAAIALGSQEDPSKLLSMIREIKSDLQSGIDFADSCLSDRVVSKAEPVVLRDLIQDCVAFLPRWTGKQSADTDLVVELPQHKLTIPRGNQVTLKLALVTIVQNAMQHGVPPITIRVIPGDCSIVEVSSRKRIPDDGEVSKIRAILSRSADSAPVAGKKGYGLPLANFIIRKHGGRIDLDNSLQQGTRFRIHLNTVQGVYQ